MTLLDGPEVEAALSELSELYDRYSRTVYGVGLRILGAHASFLRFLGSSAAYAGNRSST
jgi:hypothetical protein